MLSSIQLLTFTFLSLTTQTQTSNILVILPIAGQSHKSVFDLILTDLASKGHKITLFSQFQPQKQTQNIKNVLIKLEKNENVLIKLEKNENVLKDITNYTDRNPLIAFVAFKRFFLTGCAAMSEHRELKAIIDTKQRFDAVILTSFMNDCMLMVAPLISDVVIQVAAGPIFPWMTPPVTQSPAFAPNSLWLVTDEMTFFERARNAINTLAIRMLYKYYMMADGEKLVWKNFPNALSIAEGEERVALILQNTDPVLLPPMPGMENVVSVGGMHCKEAKGIPKDLDDFINTSPDGFILFSLGSNVQSKFLPNTKIQSILNAFARLKQNIIWKFEDNLKQTPKNVIIRKWLPQQDLLGDKRIRIFITHGGLLSLQEAVYHQVPVIGIPIFTDQPGNVARVVQLHIGVLLKFSNITEENVFEAVTQILNDKTYSANVRKYSSIFRDQPQKSIDRAVFSIEYAIRNSGDSYLLKPNNKFNLIKFHSIDVIAFVIVISVIMCVVLKKLINKFLFRK